MPSWLWSRLFTVPLSLLGLSCESGAGALSVLTMTSGAAARVLPIRRAISAATAIRMLAASRAWWYPASDDTTRDA